MGILRVAGTLPVAKSGFEGALLVAVAFLALLEAAFAVPFAVVVGEAVAAHEGGALLAAGNFELRIVFAHGVGLAIALFLVPAVLTAEVGAGIPHALGVGGAGGFGDVAVAALALAGAVGLALCAEARFTPGGKIASWVAERVSAEVQPCHVGDVEVDPDGVDTAGGVAERECGDGLDAIGDDFVDVDSVDADAVLAGVADISDTDGGAEGGVLAHELELEGGVFVFSVGGELDGSRPGGAVHVVVGLIVQSVRAGGGGGTEAGEESADFGAVVGGVEVADGRVGGAVGVVGLLFARLDADLLVGVPQAVAVGLARVLVAVQCAAGSEALRATPVAGGVRVAIFFGGVVTLRFALAGGRTDVATPVGGTRLARPVARGAGVHAGFVFVLAGWVASADGVVADLRALAEAEFAGEIPLTFLALVGFPAGAVVDVGEPFAAKLAVGRGVVPEALGGLCAVGHEGAARAVGAANIVVIPDAVVVGLASLLIPIAVLAVGDALATFPVTLEAIGTLGFFTRSKGDFAAFFAALVGAVPETETGVLQAAFVSVGEKVA